MFRWWTWAGVEKKMRREVKKNLRTQTLCVPKNKESYRVLNVENTEFGVEWRKVSTLTVLLTLLIFIFIITSLWHLTTLWFPLGHHHHHPTASMKSWMFTIIILMWLCIWNCLAVSLVYQRTPKMRTWKSPRFVRFTHYNIRTFACLISNKTLYDMKTLINRHENRKSLNLGRSFAHRVELELAKICL